MKKLIKKFTGEILLTSGIGLFAYNIFNFSYTGGTGGKRIGGLPQLPTSPHFGRYEFEYVAYYYSQDTLLMISVGAMLIIVGILIIRNKQK